jgi:glycosyltransferase involved in cell wall biosynthesis
MVGVPAKLTAGGSLRAAYLMRSLIDRTGASAVESWGRRGLPALAWHVARLSRAWRRPLAIGSTQLFPAAARAFLHGGVRGRILDLHDHPRLQQEALGIVVPAATAHELDQLVGRNVDAFSLLAVPSASFAELCRLPLDRVIVATNGTDTAHIAPGPGPDAPIVGFVSGAAPGRGIELLVDAMERVRSAVQDARLHLALQATGPASQAYLARLRAELAPQDWVQVSSVPYGDLPTFMARAAVLAIPHPANAYLDVSTPVKLFDSLAAGRPLAVTPRLETARIVREWDAGLVSDGEEPDDVAAVIARLLGDEDLRRRLGANGRRAAVEVFDWRLISDALADEVLLRS